VKNKSEHFPVTGLGLRIVIGDCGRSLGEIFEGVNGAHDMLRSTPEVETSGASGIQPYANFGR
jgi:hypothetical protein